MGKMEREHIFRREGGRCYWCKCVLRRGADDRGKDPRRFTVDHKTPVSRGGPTNFKNCVAACRHCNSSRSGGGSGPGGIARALSLTPERRREIAQAAAKARWTQSVGD